MLPSDASSSFCPDYLNSDLNLFGLPMCGSYWEQLLLSGDGTLQNSSPFRYFIYIAHFDCLKVFLNNLLIWFPWYVQLSLQCSFVDSLDFQWVLYYSPLNAALGSEFCHTKFWFASSAEAESHIPEWFPRFKVVGSLKLCW